jgi:hypothetical protein
MSHKWALKEPPSVEGAPEDGTVMELARLWINPGKPAITVRPAFRDPSAMGEMLAELSWHFASAYEQQGGMSMGEALAALRVGWARGHAAGEAKMAEAKPQ